MSSELQREVALWPTKENYDRFRSLCDDEVAATFAEFEYIAHARIYYIETKFKIGTEKVPFDPERMAIWCRANCGKVDAAARRLYAAFISTSN